MGLVLEVCVDSLAGTAAAVVGGADRIELCAALALGGLTPSGGGMAAAAGCGVPVMAMIRPRAGDFVWSGAEVTAMQADIAQARAAGLAGVVLGAALPDGRLDRGVLAALAEAAHGLDLTLHRCFDLVPDMGAALETAVDLGFRRILTSGGAVTAAKGAARIAALVAQAAGRVSIMPGGGVAPDTAGRLLALGVRELHAACAVGVASAWPGTAWGFGPAIERRTDAARVAALARAMRGEG